MSNILRTGKARHESRHRAEPVPLQEVPDYGNSPWERADAETYVDPASITPAGRVAPTAAEPEPVSPAPAVSVADRVEAPGPAPAQTHAPVASRPEPTDRPAARPRVPGPKLVVSTGAVDAPARLRVVEPVVAPLPEWPTPTAEPPAPRRDVSPAVAAPATTVVRPVDVPVVAPYPPPPPAPTREWTARPGTEPVVEPVPVSPPVPSQARITAPVPEVSAEKLAAEKLAAENLAAEKLAAEKLAAEKLAADKLAAERLAAERLAAEKRAAERLAAELAAEKLAAERLAAEKLAAERLAAEKLAAELAAQRLTAEKLAAELAAERLVAEKLAAEKLAAEKLAAEKLAAEKLARVPDQAPPVVAAPAVPQPAPVAPPVAALVPVAAAVASPMPQTQPAPQAQPAPAFLAIKTAAATTPISKGMKLESPGDAFHRTLGDEPGSADANALDPTDPDAWLPPAIATWQPPEYEPAADLDRYNAQPHLTGFYVPPKKSHLGSWIAVAVLVAAVVTAGVFFWQRHTTSAPGFPQGSGVLPGAPTTPPPGPGQVYTSADGHFAIRVANARNVREVSNSATGNGGVVLTIHMAADTADSVAVGGADLNVDMTAQSGQAALAGGMDGFISASGGTVQSVTATTFQGRPARLATFTSGGSTVKLLGVIYGSRRLYLITGVDGSSFQAVESSFVALP